MTNSDKIISFLSTHSETIIGNFMVAAVIGIIIAAALTARSQRGVK